MIWPAEHDQRSFGNSYQKPSSVCDLKTFKSAGHDPETEPVRSNFNVTAESNVRVSNFIIDKTNKFFENFKD